jgi:hypothetical protein
VVPRENIGRADAYLSEQSAHIERSDITYSEIFKKAHLVRGYLRIGRLTPRLISASEYAPPRNRMMPGRLA